MGALKSFKCLGPQRVVIRPWHWGSCSEGKGKAELINGHEISLSVAITTLYSEHIFWWPLSSWNSTIHIENTITLGIWFECEPTCISLDPRRQDIQSINIYRKYCGQSSHLWKGNRSWHSPSYKGIPSYVLCRFRHMDREEMQSPEIKRKGPSTLAIPCHVTLILSRYFLIKIALNNSHTDKFSKSTIRKIFSQWKDRKCLFPMGKAQNNIMEMGKDLKIKMPAQI